jgi:hypothetical protein
LKALLFTMLTLIVSAVATDEIAPKQGCELQELAIDAALGDPLAQHNLGVAFHLGRDVPQDLGKAARLWRKASDAGVIAAHNNLGHLLYYGRGVDQDRGEAIRLWRLAAGQGYPESQVHLGRAYADGRMLDTDLVEAYAWTVAGKRNALEMSDRALGKAIEAMADEQLEILREGLDASQLQEAEKRAAVYSRRSETRKP